jgi:hypothetical protein
MEDKPIAILQKTKFDKLTSEELVDLAVEQFADLLWETWLEEKKREVGVNESRQAAGVCKTGNNL